VSRKFRNPRWQTCQMPSEMAHRDPRETCWVSAIFCRKTVSDPRLEPSGIAPSWQKQDPQVEGVSTVPGFQMLHPRLSAAQIDGCARGAETPGPQRPWNRLEIGGKRSTTGLLTERLLGSRRFCLAESTMTFPLMLFVESITSTDQLHMQLRPVRLQ
jgi:hypothetical protein